MPSRPSKLSPVLAHLKAQLEAEPAKTASAKTRG
jgi:hypothetical protein